MARIGRVVVPNIPHHVTQRGNRRQRTFFHDDDYRHYFRLMSHWCGFHGVQIWAYCLMPNHVHLIAVPPSEESLAAAVGEAHRRYTSRINAREGWSGHLWQGRFASFPMDDRHTLAAARYIELNPVQASLVRRPEDYPWSSAAAHVRGIDDALVRVAPLRGIVADWKAFLTPPLGDGEVERLVAHENTGRPLGDEHFIGGLERILGRNLRKRKPGPKPSMPLIK